MRPEDKCSSCGQPAEHRKCDDCGAEAWLIDCGHYTQPAEIASGREDGSDAGGTFCPMCAAKTPCYNCHLNNDADDCTISAIWWEDGESDGKVRLICQECLDAGSPELGYVRAEDFAPHAVLEHKEHYGQEETITRVWAIYPTAATAQDCVDRLQAKPYELAHNQSSGWYRFAPVQEREADYQSWLESLDWYGCPSPDGSDYAANTTWAEQLTIRVGGTLPVEYQGELILVVIPGVRTLNPTTGDIMTSNPYDPNDQDCAEAWDIGYEAGRADHLHKTIKDHSFDTPWPVYAETAAVFQDFVEDGDRYCDGDAGDGCEAWMVPGEILGRPAEVRYVFDLAEMGNSHPSTWPWHDVRRIEYIVDCEELQRPRVADQGAAGAAFTASKEASETVARDAKERK